MIYTSFCCSFETSTSGHSFRASPNISTRQKKEKRKREKMKCTFVKDSQMKK